MRKVSLHGRTPPDLAALGHPPQGEGEASGIVLRPEQQPPKGDWATWLFLGGRGAGKNLAGAEAYVLGRDPESLRRPQFGAAWAGSAPNPGVR